jgi:prolyl 4-hydroxylase
VRATRGWFAQAAKMGRADALRRLAINLLTREPFVSEQGMRMIQGAAQQGDGEAAHLCAVLAAQDPTLAGRWTVALDFLAHAAEGGYALAQAQLRLLSGNEAPEAPWHALSDGVDVTQWLAVPAARTLSAAPVVQAVDGFLPAELCDWLVERARPRIAPATVNDPRSGVAERVDDVRSNSQAGFRLDQRDFVLTLVQARMAAASGFSSDGFEPPMVLHYAVGEQYRPHFDFFDTRIAGQAENVARAGQRVATFLIYLSDDFDGGETDFPRLGIRYRGARGDALLFHNVDADGAPDPRTLHAGLAPARGEKWLFSQWIRQRRAA